MTGCVDFALRQLDSEGLVIMQANRGATVSELSLAEIDEIFDLRAVLELDLLERALLRTHRRSPLLVLESGDLLAMTQLQAVSAISLAAVGAYWHD